MASPAACLKGSDSIFQTTNLFVALACIFNCGLLKNLLNFLVNDWAD